MSCNKHKKMFMFKNIYYHPNALQLICDNPDECSFKDKLSNDR